MCEKVKTGLTLSQYKLIKSAKDESPFTRSLSITKYMSDVRRRMSIWYGIPESEITDSQIFLFVSKGQS